MKHTNNGECPMCLAILDRYPTNPLLREWFVAFQKQHPEAHTSCAGRGRLDQEACFMKKASKAHYGQSAHNYGAGLDIFEMGGDEPTNIYEKKWFNKVLAPNIPPWMSWYGAPGSKFFELPHVEIKEWRKMNLKLVE